MPGHVERGDDANRLLADHEKECVRESTNNCPARRSGYDYKTVGALVDGCEASRYLPHELST